MGVVCNRDFWIREIGMPDLLPFETIEALVSDGLKCLDLALDWNVASAGENVLTVFAAAGRILQVSVANPLAQLLHGKLGVFIGGCERVMRVPKQTHVVGTGPLKNLLQRCR